MKDAAPNTRTLFPAISCLEYSYKSRIFMFIVYWLSSNCFSPTEEFLYRIKFFCEEVIRQYPPLDSIVKETQQLIDLKVCTTKLNNSTENVDHICIFQVARPAPVHSKPHEPILRSSDITPRDLAIALGLLEGDNYKALQPSDYLQHLSKGQSDRVRIYIETNEKIKLWVIKSILHYDTVSGRSQVVKFFTNTAFVSHKDSLAYPMGCVV
jgi:son of sevenless-like protein